MPTYVSTYIARLMKLTNYALVRREKAAMLCGTLPGSTCSAVSLAINWWKANNSDQTALVQVGAFDGYSNDPVYKSITTSSLNAVLVEPLEENFAALQRTYMQHKNVRLLRAAIAKSDGHAVMYKVKREGRWAADDGIGQLTSFDREHIIRHGIAAEDITPVTVPTLTLETLRRQFAISKIGFLQVDAEGFDSHIVEMALKLAYPPDFINFEHTHLGQERDRCFGALRSHGYGWIHGCHDTIAIHERTALG